MDNQQKQTMQSILYRQKAEHLNRLADVEIDTEKMLELRRLASSWLVLAENEEILADDAKD